MPALRLTSGRRSFSHEPRSLYVPRPGPREWREVSNEHYREGMLGGIRPLENSALRVPFEALIFNEL